MATKTGPERERGHHQRPPRGTADQRREPPEGRTEPNQGKTNSRTTSKGPDKDKGRAARRIRAKDQRANQKTGHGKSIPEANRKGSARQDSQVKLSPAATTERKTHQ